MFSLYKQNLCFWVIFTSFYRKPISLEISISMSKVNFCAFKKWFHVCTPFLGKSNWFLFTGKHTCLCSGLLVLLEGSTELEAGEFSAGTAPVKAAPAWPYCGEGLAWISCTQFLKIRGLLLQMKMFSSLHLDKQSTDVPAEWSSFGLTQHPQGVWGSWDPHADPGLHEDGKSPVTPNLNWQKQESS